MHLAYAKKKLVLQDPRLAELFSRVKLGTHTARGEEPYTALISAIAHQMVHGKAAEACLRRLREKTHGITKKPYPANAVVQGGIPMLRACGFSTNKSLAILELAHKELARTLPTKKTLQKMSDAEIIKTLVPLRGIGTWTVEMYLMFSLGRMDVFPVDDFGVREGYRLWKGKRVQEKPAYLAKIAQQWAPYRTVVALALWKVADSKSKYKK